MAPKRKIEKREYKQTDPRLGRHLEHDPKSKLHKLPRGLAPRRNIHHHTYGAVLDQQNLGACVGAACAHWLNSDPFRSTLTGDIPFASIEDAYEIYSMATAIDGFPGTWPKTDTGTSALAAMKVLTHGKRIKSYRWALGIEATLTALAKSPLLVGIPWYESMFDPDSNGLVKIAGRISGGHEILAVSYKIVSKRQDQNLVGFRNSWGPSYGIKGTFSMTVATLTKLLARGGDVVSPIG